MEEAGGKVKIVLPQILFDCLFFFFLLCLLCWGVFGVFLFCFFKLSSWACFLWLCLSVDCQYSQGTSYAFLSGIQVQKHFLESHTVLASVIVSGNEKSVSFWFSCLSPLQKHHFVLYPWSPHSLHHNDLYSFLKETIVFPNILHQLLPEKRKNKGGCMEFCPSRASERGCSAFSTIIKIHQAHR